MQTFGSPRTLALKRKIILLNAGIAGGLLVSYVHGSPLWIIILCGVLILVIVNVVLLFRLRDAQRNDPIHD